MSGKIKFAAALLLTIQSAGAIETDQYLSATVPLKDSADAINEYISKSMDRAIARFNKKEKDQDTCRSLATEVFTQMVGRFSISRISRFAETSEDIERFPVNEIKMKEYFKDSIYSEAAFPINMVGLARTINVGGVYVSTDKLGHFALLGRNYYNRYKRYLKKYSEEKATVEAINKGIRQEVSLLGYTLGGVLSFADLEANFQGLMFGKEMCQGEKPYLVYTAQGWQKNPERTFDVRNYFNPKFDETYNQNLWRPNLWKKVEKKITKSYCDLLQTEVYQARLATYATRLENNFNDILVRKFVEANPKFDRQAQAITCPAL
jgi:hypothetical protein